MTHYNDLKPNNDDWFWVIIIAVLIAILLNNSPI